MSLSDRVVREFLAAKKPKNPKNLKPVKGEDRFVEYDEDSKSWGIFGDKSGFCYSLDTSERQANDRLKEWKKNEKKASDFLAKDEGHPRGSKQELHEMQHILQQHGFDQNDARKLQRRIDSDELNELVRSEKGRDRLENYFRVRNVRNANDFWVTREQVAQLCPACATKMASMGISKVRASVLFGDERLMTAAKWESLPKGWTEESVKKFWGSLTGDVKHKVTKCIKKMKDAGGVDDPGAFCASLADRVEGKGWRSR